MLFALSTGLSWASVARRWCPKGIVFRVWERSNGPLSSYALIRNSIAVMMTGAILWGRLPEVKT
jgi:hypothetical protein